MMLFAIICFVNILSVRGNNETSNNGTKFKADIDSKDNSIDSVTMLAHDISQTLQYKVLENVKYKKCCPEGEYLNLAGMTRGSYHQTPCVPYNNTYTPLNLVDEESGSMAVIKNSTVRQVNSGLPICPPDHKLELLMEGMVPYHITTSGKFVMQLPSGKITVTDYCSDHAVSDMAPVTEAALLCFKTPTAKDSCGDRPCVSSCCGFDKTYVYNTGCVPSNELYSPQFKNKNGEHQEAPDYSTHMSILTCPKQFLLRPEQPGQEHDEFYLLPSGDLFTTIDGLSRSADEYCVTYFSDSRNSSSESIAMVCVPEVSARDSKAWFFILTTSLMTLSCLFLLITLVIHVIVPDLRNLHGKNLISYIIALLFAMIFLVIAQTMHLESVACKVVGIGIQLFFLSAFFWLNVMSFDIWWGLRGWSGNTGGIKHHTARQFIRYSVYAWGSPLIITGVAIILDFVPGIPDSVIKPKYGQRKCWLDDDSALAAYFYGPIGVLLLVNLIFFILTSWTLYIATKVSKHAIHQSTTTHKKRYLVYLKLFLVMGVIWNFEIISWKVGPPNMWLATDIINALQGLLVFIIVICKRKTFNQINQTLKCFCRKIKCPVKRNLFHWSRSYSIYTGEKSSITFKSVAIKTKSTSLSQSGSESRNIKLLRLHSEPRLPTYLLDKTIEDTTGGDSLLRKILTNASTDQTVQRTKQDSDDAVTNKTTHVRDSCCDNHAYVQDT